MDKTKSELEQGKCREGWGQGGMSNISPEENSYIGLVFKYWYTILNNK